MHNRISNMPPQPITSTLIYRSFHLPNRLQNCLPHEPLLLWLRIWNDLVGLLEDNLVDELWVHRTKELWTIAMLGKKRMCGTRIRISVEVSYCEKVWCLLSFLHAIGRYCVTGFLTTRSNLIELFSDVIHNLCNSWTRSILMKLS